MARGKGNRTTSTKIMNELITRSSWVRGLAKMYNIDSDNMGRSNTKGTTIVDLVKSRSDVFGETRPNEVKIEPPHHNRQSATFCIRTSHTSKNMST